MSCCQFAHLEVIQESRWRATIGQKLQCHKHLGHRCDAVTATNILNISEERFSLSTDSNRMFHDCFCESKDSFKLPVIKYRCWREVLLAHVESEMIIDVSSSVCRRRRRCCCDPQAVCESGLQFRRLFRLLKLQAHQPYPRVPSPIVRCTKKRDTGRCNQKQEC